MDATCSCIDAATPRALFIGIAVAIALLTAAVITILPVVAWWKIFNKAGFSGWLALLMLVPIVNVVLLLVIAFMDWPVLQELRRLRQSQSPPPQV